MPTSAEVGPTKKGEYMIKPDETTARPEGFRPGLAVGAQFQLTDMRSVVGQPDGTTITIAAAIDGSLEYNKGKHEWRTVLSLGAGVSRTPAIEEFIKTRDALTGESIYLFHALPWLGPFARFALNTQMFRGNDVRAVPTTYSISRQDGTKDELFGGHLELTEPFSPMTLKQSLGAFVQPVSKDRIRAEIRAGMGAQEVFAKNQLAVTDDAATAITEVSELKNSYQVGAELVANAWGTLDEGKRVSYTMGLGVLFPFAYSELPADDTRSNLELTTIEFSAGVNVKLFEWASLDYKLAVLRQPLLVDATDRKSVV